MEYWKQYNLELCKTASLMFLYNKENSFNFVENNFYNHIRDLIALTIAMIQANNKKTLSIKILDYGSNQAVWSNISNKIDANLIDVTIFDPFSTPSTSIVDNAFQISTLYKKKDLVKKKYDIIIFGSVAQYDEKFLSNLNPILISQTKYILFTHTPMSLKETFKSRQFTGYSETQTIHSYQHLNDKFKALDFSLFFKSTLSPKEASLEERFLKDTVYANLLFIKN